jgi:hypothetical protein
MAFAADAVELWVFDQYPMVSGRVWRGFAEAAGGGERAEDMEWSLERIWEQIQSAPRRTIGAWRHTGSARTSRYACGSVVVATS